MLQAIRTMMSRKKSNPLNMEEENTPLPEICPQNVPLAAAALLLEEAMKDDAFEPTEEQAIIQLLMKKYHCSKLEALKLIQEAMAQKHDDEHFYHYVRLLKEQLNEEGREDIIEMLWDVAMADGDFDDSEAELIKRIANMLYISEKRCLELREKAKISIVALRENFS